MVILSVLPKRSIQIEMVGDGKTTGAAKFCPTAAVVALTQMEMAGAGKIRKVAA